MGAARLGPERVRELINAQSREPFRELCSDILAAAPTQGAIADLAERNPDRWGQLLAIVARLGGFNDKLEVEGTLHQTVSAMSDAELAARIAALDPSLDYKSNSDSPKPQ